MKLIVPIRGQQDSPNIESCDSESTKLIRELPTFSDDPILIRLLDDEGDNKSYLAKIQFRFQPVVGVITAPQPGSDGFNN